MSFPVKTDIIAAGCAFPSGPTLALAHVALQTQLALTRNHPFAVDRCGIPVKTSLFPQPVLNFNAERWEVLANNALQDALQYAPFARILPSRLWLVLPPSQRAGVPAQLAELLTASLQEVLPGCLEVKICRGSHAEGFTAIEEAIQPIASAGHRIEIVLAVDSWQHPDALMWLERESLLHGSCQLSDSEARPNPYGRLPGEGAAAIILAANSDKLSWCTLEGVATGQELIPRNDERPCTGLGLTQVARQAVSQARGSRVTHLVTDMNGEPYRSDEYGFTVSRLHSALSAHFERIAPVLATGDLGCASAITHLALSAWGLKQSPATPARYLILSSSDDERRSAIVLGNTTMRETL